MTLGDKKISALAPAGPLTGAELLALVQSGGDVRATLSAAATFILTNGGPLSVAALPAALKRLNSISIWSFMSAAQIADVQTGTPTLDVTVAVNACLAAAAAATPPLSVWAPAGVYGLSGTLIQDTGVQFIGAGKASTIWRRLPGSSARMYQTKNFDALVGTNTSAAPNQFGLSHMAFDGNKFNTSGTADNICIYGYDYDAHHIESYRSTGRGFFSQWGNITEDAAFTGMESRLSYIKTHHNNMQGLVFQGPHDSHLSHIFSFINGLDGIRVEDGTGYSAGGTMLDHVQSYYNCTTTIGSCIYLKSPLYVVSIAGGSAQTGGAGITVDVNGFIMGGVLNADGNLGPGIVIAGANSIINGIVSTNNVDGADISGNTNVINAHRVTGNSGNGVSVTGNNNIIKNGTSTGNGTNYANSGTGNTVDAGQAANNKGVRASVTAPASTSAYTMQGLNLSITPGGTGTVDITICGTIIATDATVNNGIAYQISYGTGSAPVNGDALTGTQVGAAQKYTSAVAPTAAADVHQPFSLSTTVAGLTLGTAYWIDLAAEAITTVSGVGFENVQVKVVEK